MGIWRLTSDVRLSPNSTEGSLVTISVYIETLNSVEFLPFVPSRPWVRESKCLPLSFLPGPSWLDWCRPQAGAKRANSSCKVRGQRSKFLAWGQYPIPSPRDLRPDDVNPIKRKLKVRAHNRLREQ